MLTQSDTIQSLQRAVEKANDNKARCEALEALCKKATETGDAAILSAAAAEWVEVAQLIGDESMQARALRCHGVADFLRADFSSALKHFQSSLAEALKLNYKEGIAAAAGNMGIVYKNLSDYDRAIEYINRSLEAERELNNTEGIARNLGNLGLVQENLGNYFEALECFEQALAADELLENYSGVAVHCGNLGGLYYQLGEYSKALEYLLRALKIDEEQYNDKGIAKHTGNIGIVHASLDDYSLALEYFESALRIETQLQNKQGIANNTGHIGSAYFSLGDYTASEQYFRKALEISLEIGDKLQYSYWIHGLGGAVKELGNSTAALEYFEQCLHIRRDELQSSEGVADVLVDIGSLNVELKRFDLGVSQLNEALLVARQTGDKPMQFATLEELALAYEAADDYKMAYEYYRQFHKLEKEVMSEDARNIAQRLEVEKERAIAAGEREILNNVLPREITARLMRGENLIADHFDNVSILFMDIVGFTQLSSRVTPQQLVHLLNAVFSATDAMIKECGMEKIKTIGDAYMAVAGAPIPCADHAMRSARAALGILDAIKNLRVDLPAVGSGATSRDAHNQLQVRIGIHCGPVAAGVVGESKFLYDLWGDAVNTASRMESHGEVGKVHVSEEFVRNLTQILSPDGMGTFSPEGLESETPSPLGKVGMGLIERGEIEIKGKGMMRTFFLQSIES